MKIKTNHHWYPILNGWELTDTELKDYDHLDHYQDYSYFKYRGYLYLFDDFMRINFSGQPPEEFKEWDAYMSDSFFSGILIRLNKEGDAIQIATYFS